jgi:ferredoxin--NADP+ reductase
MSDIGTSALPLRVAIIGSGPSAFYAAEALLKQNDVVLQIDMYDRLPTPYGLVRGGVAPDHPKIKSVTKVYDRIAASPNFHFYGNVEFGRDITHDDLKARYHQIVYAVGAQSDRRMGIPGEDLPGSYAATEFVGWYNAHPDYRDLQFDLSQERVAVIGNGNVAMDVARILGSSYEELRKTDIADYALEALRNSRVREIYMLGRRGPAQAAFTNPELKELGELEATDVIVSPAEATPDPLSQAWLAAHPDAMAEKNLKTLAQFAQQPPKGKPRRLYMRFLVSPVEILGSGHVEKLRIVHNELYTANDGSLRPRPTDQFEELPVGLVFRSIGYKGVALPGVPFDEKAAIIPNLHGRVIDPADKHVIPGEYVVGWIKRGPIGIIGTNKPDAVETVKLMLEDVPTLTPLDPALATRESVEALLRAKKPDYVTFDDWLILDQLEMEAGQAVGRPRLKYSRIEDMLNALRKRKHEQQPEAHPIPLHLPSAADK